MRTEVGTKCEKCAKPVEAKITHVPRSRMPWLLGLGGVVLVVGAIIAISLSSGGSGSSNATPPAPIVGSWATQPGLSSIRGTSAVVELSNGDALAAGGGVGTIPIGTSELYDPATKTWKPSGSLVQARRGATAVVLNNGQVLIAGGVAGPTLLNSAELYNPATGTWSMTGSMSVPRVGSTMTLLPSGAVLVTGGTSSGGQAGTAGGQTISPTNTAEVYNPSTGKWTATQPMAQARFEASATALSDGRVLIAGGLGGTPVPSSTGLMYNPLTSAEIFDPAVGAFTGAGNMMQARALQSAARLATGDVLVAGGLGGTNGTMSLATVEEFKPTTGAWTEVSPLVMSRDGAAIAVLKNGMIAVMGGETVNQGERRSLATAEVFDPAKDVWNPAGSMACPRSEAGAVVLSDGSVLAVAGDTAFPGQPPVAQGCVDRYTP
ncbi:MAG: Kelch repeat-containing protein [Acidimicrobiales bacterium]